MDRRGQLTFTGLEDIRAQSGHRGIASLDLLVRTIWFKLLDGFVITTYLRRRLVGIRVTTDPTAKWVGS